MDRVFHVFLIYLKNKFITWPQRDQRQATIDSFERKAYFPNVLGANDGTHIENKAPKQHLGTNHSLILQAVCREDMRFAQPCCCR